MTTFSPFRHSSKMTVTWLFATFFDMFILSRTQHAGINITIHSAFLSCLGCQNSALIFAMLVASLLILGYDGTASSNSVCVCLLMEQGSK